MVPLPSPAQLKSEMPISAVQQRFIDASRKTAKRVLHGHDERLACIIGPCSIHEPSSALEYAKRLKLLSQEIQASFFPVMRVFCEKPRTRCGWKGMIYDPDLNDSCDLAKGLRQVRALLLSLVELEVPAATEFLDPLIAPYFEDLITWGFIGARTSASQPHRQLVSSFSFPVGFKNSIYGEIGAALNGIYNAREPHVYFGLSMDGTIASLRSKGNPWAHLVLRGSEKNSNFDPLSIGLAAEELTAMGLEKRLLIDCSHGNSGKNHRLQPSVFQNILAQIEAGSKCIAGVMIESHLFEGSQPHHEDPQKLSYGLSITDSCLGWEETRELFVSAGLPTSISSVQN